VVANRSTTDAKKTFNYSLSNLIKATKTIQSKGKSQLFRRKSELPHDLATLNALEKHKFSHDLLTGDTPSLPKS
jgi:hypothetical protein